MINVGLPTKYYNDTQGNFLGGFAGVRLPDGREILPEIPAGAVEIPAPPVVEPVTEITLSEKVEALLKASEGDTSALDAIKAERAK